MGARTSQIVWCQKTRRTYIRNVAKHAVAQAQFESVLDCVLFRVNGVFLCVLAQRWRIGASVKLGSTKTEYERLHQVKVLKPMFRLIRSIKRNVECVTRVGNMAIFKVMVVTSLLGLYW